MDRQVQLNSIESYAISLTSPPIKRNTIVKSQPSFHRGKDFFGHLIRNIYKSALFTLCYLIFLPTRSSNNSNKTFHDWIYLNKNSHAQQVLSADKTKIAMRDLELILLIAVSSHFTKQLLSPASPPQKIVPLMNT